MVGHVIVKITVGIKVIQGYQIIITYCNIILTYVENLKPMNISPKPVFHSNVSRVLSMITHILSITIWFRVTTQTTQTRISLTVTENRFDRGRSCDCIKMSNYVTEVGPSL